MTSTILLLVSGVPNDQNHLATFIWRPKRPVPPHNFYLASETTRTTSLLLSGVPSDQYHLTTFIWRPKRPEPPHNFYLASQATRTTSQLLSGVTNDLNHLATLYLAIQTTRSILLLVIWYPKLSYFFSSGVPNDQ